MNAALEIHYSGRSGVEVGLTECRIGVATDRPPDGAGAPTFRAEVARPTVLRDALQALSEVGALDDHVKRRAPAGGRTAARSRYAEWVFQAEQERVHAHDPIVSVYPDGIMFEVASADGRAYASVVARNGLFHRIDGVSHGSARCDLGADVRARLGRVRGYRRTQLSIGADGLAVGLDRAPRARVVPVGSRWLARFSRTQRALVSTSTTALDLGAADLTLLLRAAAGGARQPGPRALRLDLERGGRVRARFEPAGEAMALSHTWRDADRTVRLWGRDALAPLEPLAASARRVRLWFERSGGPWICGVDLGELSVTLAFAGGEPSEKDHEGASPDAITRACAAALAVLRAGRTNEVAREARAATEDARQGLAALAVAGVAAYEPAHDVWRARPWFGAAHAQLTEKVRQSSKRESFLSGGEAHAEGRGGRRRG